MGISKAIQGDVSIDESYSTQINNTETHNTNANSKLDRRRRIEDLDEEKRLREELSDF